MGIMLVHTGMSIYWYIPAYTRPSNHDTGTILPPIDPSHSKKEKVKWQKLHGEDVP